ncbi:MAG: sulfite exporter TauE/SafE family protein [Defluviitoga tunisiensis]
MEILIFAIVGFVAQIIDGALGMLYGVTCNSLLLALGIHPALASASVHFSEVFTTGVSGIAHWKFGNVDKEKVKKLLIPGVIGGIIGAYLLSNLPSNIIKPIVSIYLLIVGIKIIYMFFTKPKEENEKLKLVPLAFFGGLLDAIGGGGWGPIVTSTLVSNGHTPSTTIGSVNLTEFFVTIAQSITFFFFLTNFNYKIILGLIIGGVIAAPLAAYMTKKLPSKYLLLGVGIAVCCSSIRDLIRAF